MDELMDECEVCGDGYPGDQLLKDWGKQSCAVCAGSELDQRMRMQELSVAFRQEFYDILFPDGRPLEQHISEAHMAAVVPPRRKDVQ